MRWRGIVALLGACVLAGLGAASAAARSCPHLGRPALAADARPHALRVFAIQLEQRLAQVVDASSYAHAIDCVMRIEVRPFLARGRPNLVVFDEDIGLEALAAGSRGAGARYSGTEFPHATDSRFRARRWRRSRHWTRDTAVRSGTWSLASPELKGELGKAFVAATDQFVRVFMSTMAGEARRDGVYVIASNTQAPFRLTRDRRVAAALRGPGARSAYVPTSSVAYDEAFLWGPRVVHPSGPAPLRNLLALNREGPADELRAGAWVRTGPASRRRGPREPPSIRDSGNARTARVCDEPPRVRIRPGLARSRVRRRQPHLHALP